ncbi:hypothetical protein D3C78_1234930 [compost metagenome]
MLTRPRLGEGLGIPVVDDAVSGNRRRVTRHLGTQALVMVSQVALREAVTLDFFRVFHHRQHALVAPQCRRAKVDQHGQLFRETDIQAGAGHFIAQHM